MSDDNFEHRLALRLEGSPDHGESGGEVQEWLASYDQASHTDPYSWTYPLVLEDIQRRVEDGAMDVDTAIAVKNGIDRIWGSTEE